MKKLRLSRGARARLKEIVRRTIADFGPIQADKYEAQLSHRLGVLCCGNPPHGRSCEILADRSLHVSDLLFYREGMHYIIYQETEEVLLVHDIVHVARNLPALIAGIEAQVLE